MDRSLFGNFAFLDRNLDWMFWDPVRIDPWTAWAGHIPFASWLVLNARPRTLVELGSFTGVSFSAFCEAVRRSKLRTNCVAVDTWDGDPHAGLLPQWVYDDLKGFTEARYGDIARLLRKTFDEALGDIPDGSVDLLHIDGFHSHEAVRHDFETWEPKLSSRGVVLFHDVAMKVEGFGVWKFWEELTQRYPGFAFAHSAGLGVLAVGNEVPKPVLALCTEEDPKIQQLVRMRFERMGARMELHHLLLVEREARAKKERDELAAATPQP